MIKVLVTTSHTTTDGVSVHALVIDFPTLADAQEAAYRINNQRFSPSRGAIDQTARILG